MIFKKKRKEKKKKNEKNIRKITYCILVILEYESFTAKVATFLAANQWVFPCLETLLGFSNF